MYARPLALSQWQQHKNPAGQPYLHNPLTGEVRWLYSRFFDSATKRDYLVNVVTNERLWATPENDYLSPKPPGATPHSSAANSKTVHTPLPDPPGAMWNREGRRTDAAARPAPTAGVLARGNNVASPAPVARPPPVARPAGVGPGGARTNGSGNLDGAGAGTGDTAGGTMHPSFYAGGDTTDALALGPDEILMRAPGTGRRYIFNKRTRQSRWLSETDALAQDGNAAKAGSTPGRGPATSPVAAKLKHTLKPRSEAAQDLQRVLRGGAVRRLKILDKLRSLAATMGEIVTITAVGSVHNIEALRAIALAKNDTDATKRDANLRLLELGEYCTQRMLKADGVDSAGVLIVRQRRKKTVTRILAVIEQVDALRAEIGESHRNAG